MQPTKKVKKKMKKKEKKKEKIINTPTGPQKLIIIGIYIINK